MYTQVTFMLSVNDFKNLIKSFIRKFMSIEQNLFNQD